MNIRLSVVIGILLSVVITRPTLATQYRVEIDTSAIQGTAGALAFDFTSNTPDDNKVTILNFTHDGTTGLPETQGGLVQGDIILLLNPAPFTEIADGFFFNELLVPFTSFGTSISFTIQLTENPVGAGGIPDEFSFFILDANRLPLFSSADPLGTDTAFAICVDGTTSGLLSPFDPPTTFTPPDLLEILASGPVTPDHFLCYKVAAQKFSPFPVTLTDQFETGTFNVTKAVNLCTPADKGGEGINDPDTHLEGYQIKLGPKHQRRTVQVVNQFGEITFQTKKADSLFVPTAKDLSSTPPPPNPASHNVDHYKCYKVAKVTGFAPQQVSVTDQFNAPLGKVFDITKPTRLCNPVEKNGEDIKDPVNHLMCYQAKTKPKTKVAGVHVNNQFGPGVLNINGEAELCVPSEKTDLGPAVGSEKEPDEEENLDD
jgi:hypothetical protein